MLDLISKGRVSYAFGVGHRVEEYEHFGVDMATRGRVADEMLELLIGWCTANPSTTTADRSASHHHADRPAGR